MEALVGGELRIEVERLDEPPQGVGWSDLGESLVPGHLAVGERLHASADLVAATK